jgi:ubiquinone/menaquinone biosynthesis C-methylase UbiE
MADVYATIEDADRAVVEKLAEVLEFRAADPQQIAMREEYLGRVAFRADARVVEVGCGTGAVARAIAARSGVATVIGVDPSPVFIEKARALAADVANVSFLEGDARSLPFDDGSLDVVVFHTTLCHVPEPELALAEAVRVLADGQLVVFDGDYATTSCAIDTFDPLQACLDTSVDQLVHDPWLVRRLHKLLSAAGLELEAFRSHSSVETPSSGNYMITIIDRGADLLQAAGRIGAETGEALKAEARAAGRTPGSSSASSRTRASSPSSRAPQADKALMRLAGIEPAASRSGGARSIP